MNFKKMKTPLFSLFFLSLLSSCVDQEVTGLTTTSTGVGSGSGSGSSSTSDSTCSSTNTKILDTGIKYQTTSTGRGLFSDVQIIPGTAYEAIAYDDASATGGKATIMAAYYNGTNFVKETVAGVSTSALAAGAVTGVRLGFLNVGSNSGRPIVAWTTTRTTATATGALYVAMRSAAFGTSGTWTSQLIDSNTTATRNAFRALEMSVSPLDQVGIVYMDGAATTSRARFSYCDASCNAITDFTTMTATTDTIDATATVASAVSTGVAWCKTTGATYFPTVVFPGTSGSLGTRFASCSGTIATCKTAAGWTKVTTNIVSTVAPIMQKLLIDNSSLATSRPMILARSAAGTSLQLFQLGATCENVVAGTATTASSGNFGSANSGNAWHTIMKDTNTGLIHSVYNETTTSVNYTSTVQSVTATAIGSVTFNTVATLETLTLPAAGVGMGGAAINLTENQIYSSYGSAANDFVLHEGIVNDSTQTPTAAGQSYYQQFPDITGNILQGTLIAGVQANMYRNIAAATNNSGYPAAVYADYSIGTFANSALKYTYRGSTSSSSSWVTYTIPGTGAPMMPSLAFDHNNKPWISYYDNTTFRYYLVTNDQVDGSGTWSSYIFPFNGKTAISTAPSNDDTGVAMAYSGSTAKPVMVIANGNTGTLGLYAAILTPSTGTWSTIRSIDTIAQGVTRIKADFDTSGNVVLGYYALTTGALSPRYAQLTSISTNTWAGPIQLLNTGTVGREGIEIKINPSNGKPAMSFFDRATSTAYYAYCNKTVASGDCANSVGNWPGLPGTPITVDSGTGASALTVTTNEGILNAGLTFRSNGTADISYMTVAATQALKLGTYNGSSFDLTTLKSSATSYMGIANPHNYAMFGVNLDSVRASTGQLYNFYVGPGNYLYLTSCGD